MTHETRVARPMTEGPIARTLLVLFAPILLGNLLQTLNGSVNAMWVSRCLGATALSAAANANAVMSCAVAVAMSVAMAAAIPIGQRLGAKQIGEAKRIVGTAATFFLGLAIVIALIGATTTGFIVARLRTPPDALPLATAYLRVLFLAMPFQLAYLFVTILLRTTGDSRTPALFQLLCVALDGALNPLLIAGIGPFPALGIAGSATATLIAQSAGLSALTLHLYRTRHILCLQAGERRLLRPDWRIVRALIARGWPIGLDMAVVSLSMVMMISLVNRSGAALSAAYAACLPLWNYVQMPLLAMGMAVTPMASQNLGARRPDRVRQIALVGCALNVAMATGMVAIVVSGSRWLLGMFLPSNAPMLHAAQHINAVVAWSFIPFGVTFVLASVIRASGSTLPPLILLFVALWCIRAPFASLMMNVWGPEAIWASFALGSTSAMLMMIAHYRWASGHKTRQAAGGATAE